MTEAADNSLQGMERRSFVRLEFSAPLGYKVCKQETVSRLLNGYTSNVSIAGLLCRLTEKVNIDDILWLCFDRATLAICAELEKNAFIYQNGVIGKVVRIDPEETGDYQVGVRFITREETNLTHVYPVIHFLNQEQGRPNEQT
jgi:hypothetical protein